MTEQEQEDKRRKDLSKEDQEQVEKTVKPSPKKKPPRVDRQNRRIKVNDPDMDSSDKDMSLNRKDIGGSVIAFDFDPIDPETSDSKPVSKKKPRKKSPPSPEKVAFLVETMLKDMSYDKILSCALEGDDIARKAIPYIRSPFPPGWKRSEVFEYVQLNLRSLVKYRNHMRYWDDLSYVQNWIFLRERRVNESLTSGSEYKEAYYSAMLECLQESYREFLQDHQPLTSDSNFDNATSYQVRRTPTATLSELSRLDIPKPLQDKIKAELLMREYTKTPQDLLLKKGAYAGVELRIPSEQGTPQKDLLPSQHTGEAYEHLISRVLYWFNHPVHVPEMDLDLKIRVSLDYALYEIHKDAYRMQLDASQFELVVALIYTHLKKG